MSYKDLARVIAKKYRDNPSCWTKGAYARDKDGNYTQVDGLEARQWCFMGMVSLYGLSADEKMDFGGVCLKILESQYGAGKFSGLSGFNDTRDSVLPIIELCEEVARS